MTRLARDRKPLTVCPLSNLRLRVVQDLAEHPLRHMLDRDLLVTLNSDDPAYFGGYVNDNFNAVQHSLDLGRDELVALARNSFVASMMPAAREGARARRVQDRAVAAVDLTCVGAYRSTLGRVRVHYIGRELSSWARLSRLGAPPAPHYPSSTGA